jgi:hypothetical protein
VISLALEREEFAARRRKVQDDLVERLQGVIGATFNEGDIENLDKAIETIYIEVYQSETDEPMRRGPLNRLRTIVRQTLGRANSDSNVHATSLMVASAIINAATEAATDAEGDGLVLEWVTMHDSDVRETHARADGQRRPPGENFDVGGHEMPYPGWPGAPVDLWINCRCVLQPSRGSLSAASFPAHTTSFEGNTFTATPALQSAVLKHSVHDYRQLFAYSNSEQSQGADMTVTAAEQTEEPTEDVPEVPYEEAEAPAADVTGVPWHGVLAPEGVMSGDGRMFAPGALSHRDLPLPLTWQKMSADGHDNSVVVAMIEQAEVIDGLFHGAGHFLSMNEAADEVIGLIGEFGRFGVSVDADETVAEFDEDAESVTFTSARVCSASIVAIPAFAEAYVALGPSPVLDSETPPETDAPLQPEQPDEEPTEAEPEDVAASLTPAEKVAAIKARAETESWADIEQFIDVAPGRTEDGPGWLTHPVDTDRLRDYWVRGPGAAKIAWGTPGDFNRCRANVAEYVKPQHLSGYCANRHYDALGFWPGEHHAAKDTLELSETDPAPALTIKADGGFCAPSEWFKDPEFSEPTALTVTDEGEVYGHIAQWGVCHIGLGGKCVTAPPSASNYDYFAMGEVQTTDGPARVGQLTIAIPHADPKLGLKPAAARSTRPRHPGRSPATGAGARSPSRWSWSPRSA